MREVFTMWRHTKMVVLVGLTAGAYAAVLIPLKGIPLIPGYTEFRPANAIPVVFSLLFGPAVAWGTAFGNLIGDLFGTLGLGSIGGFVGNFFYGYVPYKVWGHMGIFSAGGPLDSRTPRALLEHGLVALLASAACAAIVGFGTDVLGLVPFGVLASVIALNNLLAAGILGPLLLWLLYPRARRWDILWTDVMDAAQTARPPRAGVGVVLMWVGGLGALVAGILVSTGLYAALPFTFGTGASGPGVVAAVLPLLVVFAIGCWLA
ncbi:MAG: QueT transporter family protein [Candidatus Latescibacterota bacterium]